MRMIRTVRLLKNFVAELSFIKKCESLDLDFERLITFFKHISLKQFSGNKNQKIVIPYLLSYEIEIQKKLQTIKKNFFLLLV
jgi:hypothetical protein